MTRGPVVFIGTGPVAVPLLEELIAKGEKTALVITRPDRPTGRGRKTGPVPVAKAAMELGLPLIKPESVNEPEILGIIGKIGPDFVILADYGLMLKKPFLEIARFGALNMHPSLLPRWRGPSPVVSPMLHGERTTGVSVMKMDPGMDTGPLYAQKEIPIPEGATGGEMTELLAREGARLLVETLDPIREGKLKPLPQSVEGATVSALITAETARMDWNLTPALAAARINALSPRPGVKTVLRGRVVKLLCALPSGEKGQPGLVSKAGREGITAGLAEGSILITRIQPEGKTPMDASAFVIGGNVAEGDRFTD